MKPRRLIGAIIALALLCAGAAPLPTLTGPAALTVKPYQDVADALPRGDGTLKAQNLTGGRIELPAGDILLTQPLLIGSGVEVVGKGWGATRLYYDGPGAAVRFTSYAGHKYHVGGTVRELSIYSSKGDGVAIEDGMHAEAFTVHKVIINAGGDAMRFRGTELYKGNVQTVIVAFAGRFVLDSNVVGMHVDDLNFCNPARAIETKTRPVAMVNVEGEGSIVRSRLEGPWGTPLLRTNGDFTISENHIEPTAYGGPQMIFEGYAALAAHPRAVSIDRPRFVQPRTPIELRGQVTVNVTSDDPGNEADGGYRDLKNPLWNIAECYRVGPMAKLCVNGTQVLPVPRKP